MVFTNFSYESTKMTSIATNLIDDLDQSLTLTNTDKSIFVKPIIMGLSLKLPLIILLKWILDQRLFMLTGQLVRTCSLVTVKTARLNAKIIIKRAIPPNSPLVSAVHFKQITCKGNCSNNSASFLYNATSTTNLIATSINANQPWYTKSVARINVQV